MGTMNKIFGNLCNDENTKIELFAQSIIHIYAFPNRTTIHKYFEVKYYIMTTETYSKCQNPGAYNIFRHILGEPCL